MEIANPIYDIVFKYLMDDQKVARTFLAAVTKLDIISLEVLPQEFSADINKDKEPPSKSLNLTVYRLDFSARIKQADGSEKIIIIELQKSNLAHSNIRFRKYLGKQYMNQSFFQWITDSKNRKHKMGLPIFLRYQESGEMS